MPRRIDCLMVAQEVFDEVPPCLPVSLGGSSERGEDPLFGYVGAGPRRLIPRIRCGSSPVREIYWRLTPRASALAINCGSDRRFVRKSGITSAVRTEMLVGTPFLSIEFISSSTSPTASMGGPPPHDI